MLTALLIDDEKPALQELEFLLAPYFEIIVAGLFTDPLKALDEIKKSKPQVIFMDINMPQLQGTDLASKIMDISPKTHIVFVTAYDQHAVEAFELNAIDYLLKPVSEQRLAKTIQRISIKSQIVPDTLANRQFKINCLGSFSMGWVNESPIKWRTQKTKELIALLVHNRGREIRRDYFVEYLWPKTEPEKAINQLYGGIHYIRKTLESYGVGENLVKLCGRYCLELGDKVMQDSAMFKIQASDIDANTSLENLEAIDAFYRGDYLAGEGWLWAYPNREQLSARHKNILVLLSQKYMENESYDKAEAVLKKAYVQHPYSETITLGLLQLYKKTNKKIKATTHFKAYEEILNEDLGIKPQADIQRLFDTIK